jgi:hypothetical protein
LKRSMTVGLGGARGSPTNLLFALSQQMGLGLVHGGVAASAPPAALLVALRAADAAAVVAAVAAPGRPAGSAARPR